MRVIITFLCKCYSHIKRTKTLKWFWIEAMKMRNEIPEFNCWCQFVIKTRPCTFLLLLICFFLFIVLHLFMSIFFMCMQYLCVWFFSYHSSKLWCFANGAWLWSCALILSFVILPSGGINNSEAMTVVDRMVSSCIALWIDKVSEQSFYVQPQLLFLCVVLSCSDRFGILMHGMKSRALYYIL